jgi:hypothetical protein
VTVRVGVSLPPDRRVSVLEAILQLITRHSKLPAISPLSPRQDIEKERTDLHYEIPLG